MKTFLNLIAGSCFILTVCACGGEHKKEPQLQLRTEETVVTATANEVHLVISGSDAMQFDKKELRVKSGQNVKLTLRHTGRMRVDVMGHNFVLLKQGVNGNAFGAKAASARATGYIPEHAKTDVLAYTTLIGGGQTTSVTFKAPAVGVYEFICSFPGHYALMKGKFIVE